MNKAIELKFAFDSCWKKANVDWALPMNSYCSRIATYFSMETAKKK